VKKLNTSQKSTQFLKSCESSPNHNNLNFTKKEKEHNDQYQFFSGQNNEKIIMEGFKRIKKIKPISQTD
jgi:hypothetical protein